MNLRQKIIVLAFLIAYTNAFLFYATENPVCPNNAILSMTFAEDTTPTEFDEYTYFYQADKGDSVQLLLKNGGDGTNNFKITHFDATFSNSVTVEADSSSALGNNFLGFVNQFLVIETVTSSGITYHAYKFDPSSTANMPKITLNIPTADITTLTRFLPLYNADGASLFVGISSPTQSGIYEYVWPTDTSTSITPTRKGSLIAHEFTTISGHPNHFWDEKDRNLVELSATNTYAPHTTLMAAITVTDKVVKSYGLRLGNVVLSVMDLNMKAGKLVHFTGNYYDPPSDLPVSTSVYVEYTDFLSNFMTIGATRLHWRTVNESSVAPISTDLTSIEIMLSGILNVAMSGNKAVLLYADKLDYYQHMGQGRVQLVKSHSYTTTDLTLDAQGQWRITAGCICPAISRFACLSSTLNCMIINKAQKVCDKISDWTP